jgi:hypothetical protein
MAAQARCPTTPNPDHRFARPELLWGRLRTGGTALGRGNVPAGAFGRWWASVGLGKEKPRRRGVAGYRRGLVAVGDCSLHPAARSCLGACTHGARLSARAGQPVVPGPHRPIQIREGTRAHAPAHTGARGAAQTGAHRPPQGYFQRGAALSKSRASPSHISAMTKASRRVSSLMPIARSRHSTAYSRHLNALFTTGRVAPRAPMLVDE